MKILFISDIHGIITNLNVIYKYNFDTLVFLGDLYNNGYEENSEINNEDVKNFMINNRSKIICIKGNCDNNFDYIALNIPVNEDFIKIKDGEKTIVCSHGNKYNRYNYSFVADADAVIYGHEHIPYIEKINGTVYICVGSLSKPRGGSKSSFGFYDNGTFIIYDVDGQIIDKITI